MKRSVFENSSLNQKEIHEYIENYVMCVDDGSGTTYNITDEEYTINDDMSVSFGADNINIHTNNKPIPFVIAEANIINFEKDFIFNNTNNLPKKCKTLNFIDCLLEHKNVIIDSNVSSAIDIDYIYRNVIFESLTCKSNSNLQRIDISRTIIKTLSIDIPSVYAIYLTKCDIDIFNHIHFDNIENLYCYECPITSLYDMHNLNGKINDDLRIDVDDIVSFRGIENCKIPNIYLHQCNTLNNIILCLLNNTSKITLMPYDFGASFTKGMDIIDKYLKNISKRKDYLMDCAVELIDNGFEEAAEL